MTGGELPPHEQKEVGLSLEANGGDRHTPSTPGTLNIARRSRKLGQVLYGPRWRSNKTGYSSEELEGVERVARKVALSARVLMITKRRA